jgi:hypothetical protein
MLSFLKSKGTELGIVPVIETPMISQTAKCMMFTIYFGHSEVKQTSAKVHDIDKDILFPAPLNPLSLSVLLKCRLQSINFIYN